MLCLAVVDAVHWKNVPPVQEEIFRAILVNMRCPAAAFPAQL